MHSPEVEVITIFGGAGYIGSHLTRLLLREGYHVRVFDNFSYSDEGITGIESPRLKVIDGDMCDLRAVSSAISGADTVILLGAVIGHRIKEIKDNDFWDVNFFATSQILSASIEYGVTRFLFASTDSVYGVQNGIMYETTIPEPISLYSRLKLRIEEKILSAKNRSFHPAAFRIANCHGVSERMRFDLVPNALIRDAVLKQKVTLLGGDQTRSFLHVSDCSRAFLLAIKSHINLISGELFNVADNRQNYTVSQVANYIRQLIPETEIEIKDYSPDLIDYRLSSSKIERILEFKPEVSMERSLKEMRDALNAKMWLNPYSLRYSNTKLVERWEREDF